MQLQLLAIACYDDPVFEDDSVATILRRSGHRVTPQRLLVLSALRDADGHLTAARVGDMVRRTYSEIDDSTVYRALAAAEELGFIVRFDQVGKETEFEWLDTLHHHLICRVCGRINTFDEAAFTPLAATLLKDTGFAVDMRHMAVSGLCGDCRPRTAGGLNVSLT